MEGRKDVKDGEEVRIGGKMEMGWKREEGLVKKGRVEKER